MKIFKGKVLSVHGKTAAIAIDRTIIVPIYGKRIRRSKKYQVHDTLGVKEGDVVSFVASAPISKTKKWRIVEVVGRKK